MEVFVEGWRLWSRMARSTLSRMFPNQLRTWLFWVSPGQLLRCWQRLREPVWNSDDRFFFKRKGFFFSKKKTKKTVELAKHLTIEKRLHRRHWPAIFKLQLYSSGAYVQLEFESDVASLRVQLLIKCGFYLRSYDTYNISLFPSPSFSSHFLTFSFSDRLSLSLSLFLSLPVLLSQHALHRSPSLSLCLFVVLLGNHNRQFFA